MPNFPNIRPPGAGDAVTEYDPYSGSDPEVTLPNLFYFEKGGLEGASSELAGFERDVNIYLKRLMGDQSDGLNAFRGILSRSVYWSYYGVPLITRASRELSKTRKRKEAWQVLPVLPGTVSNSVRILVDKYARDRRMEKMIAAAASAAPKRRQRKTMFGSTYYDYYTYDCLPGAGEPFHPSPMLAFLYGLGWKVDPGTTCHRRPPMPSWSWVSVYGGALSFPSDPDGAKELPTDVLTMPSSDVKVWLPADNAEPPSWVEFDEKFRDGSSPSKLIPEASPLIRLQSRVGDIAQVVFQPQEGDGDYEHSKVFVSIAGLVDATPYEMRVDCVEELPPSPRARRGGGLGATWAGSSRWPAARRYTTPSRRADTCGRTGSPPTRFSSSGRSGGSGSGLGFSRPGTRCIGMWRGGRLCWLRALST